MQSRTSGEDGGGNLYIWIRTREDGTDKRHLVRIVNSTKVLIERIGDSHRPGWREENQWWTRWKLDMQLRKSRGDGRGS